MYVCAHKCRWLHYLLSLICETKRSLTLLIVVVDGKLLLLLFHNTLVQKHCMQFPQFIAVTMYADNVASSLFFVLKIHTRTHTHIEKIN